MSKVEMEALALQHFQGKTTDQVLQRVLIIFLETPDGGDGGDGGNVYFRSTGRLSSLYDLRRAHFYGNKGGHGLVSTQLFKYRILKIKT